MKAHTIKHVAVLVMVSLLVAGCEGIVKPRVGSPWMQKLLNEGPEGPTLFKLGWRDGCETGISATSNTFQRHFYTFKQNADLALNPVYYSGWKNAYNYCQRYVFQYLRRDLI